MDFVSCFMLHVVYCFSSALVINPVHNQAGNREECKVTQAYSRTHTRGLQRWSGLSWLASTPLAGFSKKTSGRE